MPEHPIIPIPSLQLPIGAVGTDISTNNCTQCTVYKSLAADLLNEIRSIKNFVSGMAGTTSNETELIPRQHWGFTPFMRRYSRRNWYQNHNQLLGSTGFLEPKRARWVCKSMRMQIKNLNAYGPCQRHHTSGLGVRVSLKMRFKVFTIRAKSVFKVGMKQVWSQAFMMVNGHHKTVLQPTLASVRGQAQ